MNRFKIPGLTSSRFSSIIGYIPIVNSYQLAIDNIVAYTQAAPELARHRSARLSRPE
jgi:hypothetical protein